MKQRIYLCGAIDGNKNYKEDFEKAETIVANTFRSCDIVNPCTIDSIDDRLKELSMSSYLVILDDYNGDWKSNKQVQKELSICGENKIRIIHLSLLGGL